jgi:hypothetical protein
MMDLGFQTYTNLATCTIRDYSYKCIYNTYNLISYAHTEIFFTCDPKPGAMPPKSPMVPVSYVLFLACILASSRDVPPLL